MQVLKVLNSFLVFIVLFFSLSTIAHVKINEKQKKALFEIAVEEFSQLKDGNDLKADRDLTDADREWLKQQEVDLKFQWPKLKKTGDFEVTFSLPKPIGKITSIVLSMNEKRDAFLMNGYPLDFQSRKDLKDRVSYIERVLKSNKISLIEMFILNPAEANTDQDLAIQYSIAIDAYVRSVTGTLSLANYTGEGESARVFNALRGDSGIVHMKLTCGSGDFDGKASTEGSTCSHNKYEVTHLDVYGKQVVDVYETTTTPILLNQVVICAGKVENLNVLMTKNGESVTPKPVLADKVFGRDTSQISEANLRTAIAVVNCCERATSESSTKRQEILKSRDNCIEKIKKEMQKKSSSSPAANAVFESGATQ